MNDATLRKYTGHPLQLGGVRHFEIKSGKGKGVELYEVTTGSGLQFAVLKDRCLDLGWASFRGINFSYLSSTDIVAPEYFEPEGDGFLRSFSAGLLTTCGLANAGSACVDQGQSLGLHGKIANVPAEEAGFETFTDTSGKDGWRIHGRMTEAKFFGENISLTREIFSARGGKKIHILDRVKNNSFAEQPFQLLYHINFGYPLLNEGSELVLPSRSVTPRNAHAAEGLASFATVEPPQANYEEQCFYHDLKTDSDGFSYVAVLDRVLGFGVYERFNKTTLPRFTQWKQMAQGEYVMGLEPGNCFPDGRDVERKKGNLLFLAPEEEVTLELEIGILDGDAEMAQFREKIKTCQ